MVAATRKEIEASNVLKDRLSILIFTVGIVAGAVFSPSVSALDTRVQLAFGAGGSGEGSTTDATPPTPPPSVLPPTHPYDGAWTLEWKVLRKHWPASWCTSGEQGVAEFETTGGRFEGSITSNRDKISRFTIDVSQDGKAVMKFTTDWQMRNHRVRFDVSNGEDQLEYNAAGYCVAELTLMRR